MTTATGRRNPAATILVAMLAALLPSPSRAYGPSTLYTPPGGSLAPGALYARAIQTANGRMVATFEQYTTGVASFPVFESLDTGRTWSKVGDVKDTHKGWGMRWQPQLYELPQAIGSMPAGTLLAAGLVLPYDRSKCEIDLYRSNDAGRTWTFVSTIAVGGRAESGSDPVWEPFMIVSGNKLYCFYADERDPLFGRKIVLQSSSDGVKWGDAVNVVALAGQRPGMPVVTRMPDGNHLLAYELDKIGGAYFKTTADIESWTPSSRGTVFDAKGSSPYAVTQGRTIVLSSAGSTNLFTNSNNGAGTWTQIASPLSTGYSRCVVPLNNGRLFLVHAGLDGNTLNKVTYADMEFGCTATPIVPNIRVDTGAWQANVAVDTVPKGATVVLGPHPVVASGWSWTGPGGFKSTTREITLSDLSEQRAGVYTATYTNPEGCTSTRKFILTLQETSGIHRIPSTGSKGAVRLLLTLGNDLQVRLSEPGAEVRIRRLDGRTVLTRPILDRELTVTGLGSGVYRIEVVRDGALLDRKSFLVP